jgi:cell division protein FtsW (lipid II flippase)
LRVDEALRLGKPAARVAAGLRVPPELFEWLFTLAAIAFLAWQAAAFQEPEFQRVANERYRDALELRVPMAGTAAGASAPATLPELRKRHELVAQSLAAPVKARLSRLDQFANREREARADTDVQGAIESLLSETRLYREAYGIEPAGARSVPLDCAWSQLERVHEAAAGDRRRDDALRAMAAVLDGDVERARAAAATLKDAKGDPWLLPRPNIDCAALGAPAQVIAAAAELVARARASDANAGKSRAARDLLVNAPWYFGLWAAAGLLLLQFGRRAVHARRFLPVAALLWSLLGWVTQVHVEWLSDRASQTAALLRWGVRFPDFFQLAVAVSAVLLMLGLVLSPARDAPSPVRQTPSSRLGYAGFVLFTGLGWWLLLDLSASGHVANRFHALYQQVYVFAAFAALSMLAPLRLKLAGAIGERFGVLLLAVRGQGARLKRLLFWLGAGASAAALLAFAAAASRSQTQLTSEAFRLWLVLGVSWVFFVRGESALSLSASDKGMARVLALLWPLMLVLSVPLAGLVLTDDFGPLFVMLYAASIFVGAVFAFAFFDRAGHRPWLGAAAGVGIAAGWVYLLTYALYALPAPMARVAERLASVREPFSATNDQLAIITWFQESAPAEGYGLGAVPWCGEIAAAGCRGVPRQIQSDYIYTALVGVYGKAAAIALVALLALWLVRVVIHHGRATRGTVAPGSPVATQQAWLSWIAVCWVGLTLAQLAITVAGNIGWLPLTGITFPFMSFGAWSLLANTLFLALAINLPRRA